MQGQVGLLASPSIETRFMEIKLAPLTVGLLASPSIETFFFWHPCLMVYVGLLASPSIETLQKPTPARSGQRWAPREPKY